MIDAVKQFQDYLIVGRDGTLSQWAEEIRRGQIPGPLVRLRAPRGVRHVQLFSGLHRAVANDGTVEMTESDAAPLLNAGWVRVDPDSRLAQEAAV